METFVEFGKFHGSCYKAANWVYVGRTTGRGRNDTSHEADIPLKDVYLYPLTKRFEQKLKTAATV
jgi:hypothetical protein